MTLLLMMMRSSRNIVGVVVGTVDVDGVYESETTEAEEYRDTQ